MENFQEEEKSESEDEKARNKNQDLNYGNNQDDLKVFSRDDSSGLIKASLNFNHVDASVTILEYVSLLWMTLVFAISIS